LYLVIVFLVTRYTVPATTSSIAMELTPVATLCYNSCMYKWPLNVCRAGVKIPAVCGDIKPEYCTSSGDMCGSSVMASPFH
jgi:hypothetical protein